MSPKISSFEPAQPVIYALLSNTTTFYYFASQWKPYSFSSQLQDGEELSSWLKNYFWSLKKQNEQQPKETFRKIKVISPAAKYRQVYT